MTAMTVLVDRLKCYVTHCRLLEARKILSKQKKNLPIPVLPLTARICFQQIRQFRESTSTVCLKARHSSIQSVVINSHRIHCKAVVSQRYVLAQSDMIYQNNIPRSCLLHYLKTRQPAHPHLLLVQYFSSLSNIHNSNICKQNSSLGNKETVEKRLIHLMDMWEVEDAVKLLRRSVNGGVVPHPNVVLNLQQQLANLGEVECLLELHDFLKEHKLTSDAKFFHCLHEAYYNSGRIDEGVAVLRLMYHRTRKFSDVEIYFTLLTLMVLRQFPDRLDLIKSFVTDLKDAEEPVLEPGASLWKCYMMTERWSDADDLLNSNEKLRPLLPQQVARICQGVDKAQFDEVVVLNHVLDLSFLRQRLRVLVAETLIDKLVTQKEWPKLLKALKKIKTVGLPMRANRLTDAVDKLGKYMTPQYDAQIADLRLWCQGLQNGNKEE